MTEIRQGEEGNVRHRAATLLILRTDRIILAGKQQAWHGHRWQDLGEAQTLNRLVRRAMRASTSFSTSRAFNAGGKETPQGEGRASAPGFSAPSIRSGPDGG